MKKIENKMIINKKTLSFDKNKVFQGICFCKNLFFITAYDRKKENSMVYILDDNYSFVKEVKLYNNSHVGGITYDNLNNNFWITDKDGTISGYSYESFFKDGICYPIFKKINVSNYELINYKGINSCSYISYFNGFIYVGNFTLNNTAILKKFVIKNDGNIDLNSCKNYKFIDKVQGLSFYKKLDKIYLFVSTSFGRTNKSHLLIYNYNEEIKDFNKEIANVIEMPNMMEQIFVSNEKLVTLYEINSYIKNPFVKYSDIIMLNINNIL